MYQLTKPFAFISCFFFLINTLSGCLPQLSATNPAAQAENATIPLPTQVLLAAVSSPTPTSTIDTSGIPPTWTPSVTDLEGHSLIDANATRVPTRTPTPAQTIPTRTPIPPTSTPVTPSPTPTPYVVKILPPTDELGPSKLGIHVIQNNDPAIMEFIRQAQPAVVKGVGDLGFLDVVKQESPRTVTIGRVDDIFAQNYIGNPEEAARAYVDKHLDTYLAHPGVDYWEGWNEPDPNLDNMPWYTRFEQERVRYMRRFGLRTAIGGFATGVPELDEFALFVPAIETAIDFDGILTLHEYGAPEITYLYGSPLPGYPGYGDRGALKFRYRWYYREILEPAGLVIPLAITEAGIDGIIGNRPGPQGKGWRNFTSYWVDQGWATDGTQAYINQLAWYDAGTRRDGYVIGFTVFSAGANTLPQWRSYDINSILPELAAYVQGQR